MTSILAEDFHGDVGAVRPPVHDQHSRARFAAHLLHQRGQDRSLAAAVAINQDDVLEFVFRQTHQDRANISAKGLFRDRKTSRIRIHDSGESVGDNRRDHGV